MSLKDLIAKHGPAGFATATLATLATEGPARGGSVATVATVAVASTESPKSAPSVRCADCDHFRSAGIGALGHCAAGQPEPIAGLYGPGRRHCGAFLAADVADGIRRMAERWGYLSDELAWALEQAAADPDGWRRLIAADLEGRLWPGGDGWH